MKGRIGFCTRGVELEVGTVDEAEATLGDPFGGILEGGRGRLNVFGATSVATTTAKRKNTSDNKKEFTGCGR